MTFKELRNMLNRMDDEKLDQEVSVISYGMNDGTSTTDIEVGDWTTDELYIGAYFDEGRRDEFRLAMNTVCGECGNTDGDQCDKCWVKRSWKAMNRPKTFLVDVSTIIGQTFIVEADNMDEAKETARLLVNDRGFYDKRLHGSWMYDASTMWDMTEITQVMEDVVKNDGTHNYVTKRQAAKYLEEE